MDRRSLTSLVNVRRDRFAVSLSDGSYLEGLEGDTFEKLRGVFTVEPILVWTPVLTSDGSLSHAWRPIAEPDVSIDAEKATAQSRRLRAFREGVKA